MSLSSLISLLKGGVSPAAVEHDEMQKACMSGTHHIIDVREPHEYASGHLPNAVNYPLSCFEPSALPNEKPVILVCQAGSRSARALQAVNAAGRTDARHYAPGTSGWKAKGGQISM